MSPARNFGLGECDGGALEESCGWCGLLPSFLTITEFLISLISGGGFGNIKSLSLSNPTEDDTLFVVTNDVNPVDEDPFNCSCFTLPLSWESNPG